MEFRLLRADEIEVRVGMSKKNGCSLLLYKDARCDMAILDETVGAMNWQRGHSRDNANCIVSIWDSSKSQWISKEDTGTESNTEKEKGLASDSFKRACVNWGIGRELYTAPFIWVTDYEKDDSGKPRDDFRVTHIGYDNARRITELQIINKAGNEIFRYPRFSAPKQEPPKVTCDKCGKEINGVTKNGVQYYAQETKEKLGGLCIECWRAAQK